MLAKSVTKPMTIVRYIDSKPRFISDWRESNLWSTLWNPAFISASTRSNRLSTWSNRLSTSSKRWLTFSLKSSSRSSVHASLAITAMDQTIRSLLSAVARRSKTSAPPFARNCDSAADPSAGAGVGPDFGGDAVLFGLRGVLRFALAAVEFPGRREDLVGATGAAGGIEGAVVAARLAHHDVGRDRVGTAEPAADFFFSFGFRGFARFRRPRFLDLVDPFGDVAFQRRQRCFAAGAERLQPRRRRLGRFAHRSDFQLRDFEPFVVGDRFVLQLAHAQHLAMDFGAHFGNPVGERAVGFGDRSQVVVAGDEVLVVV